MTIEQLKELKERAAHLYKYLKVADRKAKVENDKQLSLSPGFWDDNERATSILKEIQVNKLWCDMYDDVIKNIDDCAVLFDFWKENEGSN